MIEVEVKLPIREAETVMRRLEHLGFMSTTHLREEDNYFDNAARQIRGNGEALRVRQITDLQTGNTESVITFKGRKIDTVSMSRQELETSVGNADTARSLFEALGFEVVPPTVVKERREFTRRQMTACVDRVHELGDFLELEIVIPEKSSRGKEAALEQIELVLRELGYSMRDTVTNSYLSMLQGVTD